MKVLNGISLLILGALAVPAYAQDQIPAAPNAAASQQRSGDQQLYGDIWERPGLSKRDWSLAIVNALVAMNHPDQPRSHLAIAKRNGVTEAKLIETITHLAFYSGWPNAVSAIAGAKDVSKT